MTEVPTITLNDGNKMPLLGLGVFQIPDHKKARQAVVLWWASAISFNVLLLKISCFPSANLAQASTATSLP